MAKLLDVGNEIGQGSCGRNERQQFDMGFLQTEAKPFAKRSRRWKLNVTLKSLKFGRRVLTVQWINIPKGRVQ